MKLQFLIQKTYRCQKLKCIRHAVCKNGFQFVCCSGHCCHLLFFLLEYEMFLAFSKVTGIETLHMLTDDELPNPNAPMPPVEKPDQMLNVIGLAFDYKTKRYFFSDIQRGYIMSVYFNGTGFETIVESR